jgi:DNA-binding MltR family transcriptional regulator
VTDITNKFWDRLHLELDTETDRSIAIVAGALIDEALKETLKALFIPALKRDRCVLNGVNSPIGSFSSRIDLCYQLGLISDVMQRDLHIVRKLRNDFAHNPFDLSFESGSVKNRIKELDDVANYKEKNAETRLNFGPPGTKHDFMFSISWRLYNLTESIKDIKPLKSPLLEFGYLDLENLKINLEQQGIPIDKT